MEPPKLLDGDVIFVRMMESVVRGREALVVLDHHLPTEPVIRFTCALDVSICIPIWGERKCLEAVGWGVTKIVLYRRSKKSSPHIMHSRLQRAQQSPRCDRKDDERVRVNHPCR